MALSTTSRAVLYPVRDFVEPRFMQLLRTTARFFEEGRSGIVVALQFKSFNIDRRHRLGVGS